MKCLEDYTIEQVRELSYEELKLVAEKAAKEEHENFLRTKLIEVIEIRDANMSLIES